ncbi:MAG: ABC transporter substrate-binding protein [Clostridia bacterium]|nr:ABC transporter substrate-binding protein [Clostridia bacterium]
MLKRITSLLLCATIIFSLAACKSNGKDKDIEGEANKKSVTASLLYSQSDTFNPYTAKTEINRQLCGLVFEPLIKLDNEFNITYRLAKEITNEDKVWTVRLIDTVFSDGTPLTAQDVVYSYDLARASATTYASALYEVATVTATDSKTVVFELNRVDNYFENLLSFPIIKAKSDTVTDSDGVTAPPIGCGRYTVDLTSSLLLQNKNYFGDKGQIGKIKLIDAPDRDAVAHYVEIGAADIYYNDASASDIVRMSGKRTQVNLNNLVYIGINSAYPELKNKYIRYAISAALDRNKICRNAFYNNALAATGFFNPNFDDAKPYQTIDPTPNLKITVENFGKIGYNSQDEEGYLLNLSGRRVKFTLLVNEENQSRVLAARLISEQLKAVGIEITVVEKSYSQYIAALQSGAFQLYLGEINILNNMDLSGLVTPGGSAAYGVLGSTPAASENADTEEEAQQTTVVAETSVSSVIKGFYEGADSIGSVVSVLLTEMPQIPICYRQGVLFYDSEIEGNVTASADDIYLSIEEYSYKN